MFYHVFTSELKKLDNKYLDKAILLSVNDVANKMDKVEPVCTGSFSMNRLRDSEIGYNSHTTGSGNIASGSASSANGNSTEARGSYSCTHGESTVASAKNEFVIGRYNVYDEKYAKKPTKRVI